MIEDGPGQGRAPSSVRLGRRLAFLGVAVLVLLSLLLLRLWYLQVLDGDNYLARANDNQIRDVAIAAPRGRIVDRNGRVIVDSRPANAVVVMPGRLPEAGSPEREAVAVRLSRAMGIAEARSGCELPGGTVQLSKLGCRIEKEAAALPYANIVIRKDATDAEAAWVLENRRDLPGVDVTRIWLRTYPHGPVAAQLVGTVGEISSEQLGKPRFAGIAQGTVIGQSGLEYQYDRYLRGRDGAERIQVDASGRARRTLRSRDPVPGRTLRLSADLGLLRSGQAALATGMSLGSISSGAAYVALDPRNGRVLAMGSAPSFDPGVFARPISEERYSELFGQSAGYPQLNRAIQSAYPAASTFKVVTSLAALDAGAISPSTTVDDSGSVKIGNIVFRNAGGIANGPVNLHSALKVSSDVYFYLLGAKLNERAPAGGPIQQWAKRIGFGRETGIDLPGEVAGTVPSPAWRERRRVEEANCAKRKGQPCGISDGRPWSVGDNVNLSIGQGDMLATPLQLAVAYSTIVNGGNVVSPRVAEDVRNDEGLVLQAIRERPARKVQIDPADRAAVLSGLRAAAMEEGGTSSDVFADFGRVVEGKTGTAERPGQADQAWYVAYVPDPRRPIVIAVTVEQGGFGAQSAAPAARLIASRWFGLKGRLVAGSSQTR